MLDSARVRAVSKKTDGMLYTQMLRASWICLSRIYGITICKFQNTSRRPNVEA